MRDSNKCEFGLLGIREGRVDARLSDQEARLDGIQQRLPQSLEVNRRTRR